MSQAVAYVAFPFAHVLLWSAHFDRARALLESLYADWSERDERMAAYALWYLAMVELRTGNYALADQHARQSRQLNGPYVRDEVASPTSLFPPTLIAAHRGDLVRARELAEEGCRLSELHAVRLHGPLTTLGIVELWSGSPAAAVDCFRSAEEMTDAADGVEPTMQLWRSEQVEALLELGLVDEAVVRLDAWEAAALRLDRAWALAHATRCRGLVAAARGEVATAVSLLADAVEQHEAAGDPFGRARALLALGVTRRRARRETAGTGGDRAGAGRLRGARGRRLGGARPSGARGDRRTDAE